MPIKRTADRSWFERHPFLNAAILLALLRCVAWFNTVLISRDSVIYISLARDWATGRYLKALAHPYHPLYPFLIALFSRGLKTPFSSTATGISIFASVLTLPALAVIFRRVRDRRVLLLGLTFFCVSPYLTRYAADILTEPLYLFCIAWSTAFLFSAVEKRKTSFFFISGIFAGLAYLTRPEGLIVAMAGGLWVGVYARRRPPARTILALILILGGTLLMASPYLLYLHHDSGQWLLTRKKRVSTLIKEITQKSLPAPRDFHKPSPSHPQKTGSATSSEWSEFRQRVAQQQAVKIRQILGEPKGPKVPPGAPLWRWLLAFLVSLSTILMGFFHGMFLPIGIWVLFRFFAFRQYPWTRADTFVLIFSGLYWLALATLLTGYGYVSRRHYAAVTMFWCLWAAIGFTYACQHLPGLLRHGALSPRIVGTALLIPILGLSVIKGTRPYRTGKYGRKIVGQWISKHRTPKHPCTILSSMTRIGYYAGCRTVFLPTVTAKDINDLRRQRIGFVVLSEREFRKAPGLKTLLEKYGYRNVYRYTSPKRHEDLRVFAPVHSRLEPAHAR